MTVQDDARERELCRIFNFEWENSHKRDGTDAQFSIEIAGKIINIDVEVKSTTGKTISTARDVGMDHIRKWRSRFWVIGFYTSTRNPELQTTLCLTPDDIEPWVASIEQKILPDFELSNLASKRLTLDDLFSICGKKDYYTVEDAKKLHKQQWTAAQYITATDYVDNGVRYYSPSAMLTVLKLRSQYIARRGATLNNPHITSSFLKTFDNTDRVITKDWALKIREVAKSYLLASSDAHPFQ